MPRQIPIKIKNVLGTERAHEFEPIDFLDIVDGGTGAIDAITALANLGGIPLTQKAQPLGVATLDNVGKVLVSQIPAIALPAVHVVADATARLALTVEEGDEAIQVDDDSQWIYNGVVWTERAITGPNPISVLEDGIPIQSAAFLNFTGDINITPQGGSVVDIDCIQARAYLRDGTTVVLMD